MRDQNPAYFAAANTTKGFISYFHEIFDSNELSRLYIIKGGPGTGKSGMMRAIASSTEEDGHRVERFYCSSDPNSLDGVFLPDKGFAIVDGTSPHLLDPIYPGAVDGIVNTGIYWNVKKLTGHKTEIMNLIRSCKRCYDRAYGFLNAIGEITREMALMAGQNLNEDKMRAQILRLSKKLFVKQEQGATSIRVLSSFNRNGIDRRLGCIPEANRVWIIRDHYYTGLQFLNLLAKEARKANQDFIYCPSCLFPDQPEALYFPLSNAAFILDNEAYTKIVIDKETHVLDMRRYIDKEIIKNNTQKLRFGKKCVSTLLDGATEAFQEASKVHDQLERYYITAMDFVSLDKRTKKLIQEIKAMPLL